MNRLAARLARAAALVLLPLALAGCGINTIPTKDEQAKAAWAEVQNQYQRRSDLIPNLVATVQGYANQEQEVLTAVTEARASATQVQVDASTITDPEQFQRFAQAQDQLTGVLGRLMMIQERYPELRSNQNFLALQSQLEGTENRIAIARRDYNEAVRDYNTEIRRKLEIKKALVNELQEIMAIVEHGAEKEAFSTDGFVPAVSSFSA